MTVHSSSRGDSERAEQPSAPARSAHWSGGPPADWEEIRARLRSYSDQRSGRAGDLPAPAPSPAAVASGKPAHIIRPAAPRPSRPLPLRAPSTEDQDYGTVFDLPVIRWWQVHNPLVMQRAILILCALLILLLLLQAF